MSDERKPCARCGGPKPPGKRRRLCDSCTGSPPPCRVGNCQRCGARTSGAKTPLCKACSAPANARRATQKRHPVEWTRDTAISAVRAWADAHDGDVPAKCDRERGKIDRYEVPSGRTAKELFGSWNQMVVAAGLQPRLPSETRATETSSAYWNRTRNRQVVTGGVTGAKRPGPNGGYA